MKETEAACWQPHCAIFDQYIPDRCARCDEGYFLEWDTGECVEQCSDGYDTDYRLMWCTENCDEHVQYHDQMDGSKCWSCDDGPESIPDCD